jgi:hypothetical protein
VFAAASILPVAWSLRQPPADWELRLLENWQQVSLVQAVALAVAAVIPAALVGGFLAGRLVGRHPAVAAFLAMTISWWVGIGMLPLAASVVGIPYSGGIVCLDGCSPFLDYQEPPLGFVAYGISVALAIAAFPGFAVPILLGVFAFFVRRRLTTILFAISVHGALSAWSIVLGGFVAYVCLALGVLVWAMWLAEPAARAEESAAIDGEAVAPAG